MKQADQLSKPTSVYLMRCEAFIKIGIAVSVGWRQTAMQTGNPFEVTVVHSRRFPNFQLARLAEMQLHEKFADRHHRGEWFAISDEEATAALGELPEEAPPETVTIEWFPYKGAPGFKETVSKKFVA